MVKVEVEVEVAVAVVVGSPSGGMPWSWGRAVARRGIRREKRDKETCGERIDAVGAEIAGLISRRSK
jgi:hypothetical protein